MVMSGIGEAFSLSHAQVLDGETSWLSALATAAALDEDIYGVNEASLEPDTDSYDNEGDDAVLSTWNWLNKADLTIQAGYFSFPLVARLTGREVVTTTDADTQKVTQSLDLWHEDSMNVAPFPMVIKMPAKDHLGVPADFIIGLYRVSFAPITFDGPVYKDGMKVNYDGTALWSTVDEMGVPFADGKKRVGKTLMIQR